jgi:uncharacterized protein
VKYLLVFLVIFLVAWRWRAARLTDQSAAQQKRERAAAEPAEIVQCAHCAVHIPAKEATQGQRGAYCSEAHRALAES